MQHGDAGFQLAAGRLRKSVEPWLKKARVAALKLITPGTYADKASGLVAAQRFFESDAVL